VVLISGLSVAIILAQNRQTIFGRAWSGFTANLGLLPSSPPPTGEPSFPATAASQTLYHKLVRSYPAAEVQPIDLPSSGITGQAYLHYDPLINKTYVFSRLTGLPAPAGNILQLWLVNDLQSLPVGITEFVTENDLPVAYSVFVRPTNLKTSFQKLLFSYDLSPKTPLPQAPFLTLNF